ncbi:MAG: hypothetical protein AAF517_23335, partial [Planctomycetota bacterium]
MRAALYVLMVWLCVPGSGGAQPDPWWKGLKPAERSFLEELEAAGADYDPVEKRLVVDSASTPRLLLSRLGELEGLEGLIVHAWQLDSIPFEKLKKLRVLHIHDELLRASELPTSVIQQLDELCLKVDSRGAVRILGDLASVNRIRSLDLSGSPITDVAIQSLGKLRSLESLYLYGTRISAAALQQQISKLLGLKRLYLDVASMDSSFPDTLSKIGIEELDLVGAWKNRPLTVRLAAIPSLKKFSSSSGPELSSLLDSLPASLTSLTGRVNRLTPETRTAISKKLPRLKSLHLE